MTLMSQLRNKKKNNKPTPTERHDAFLHGYLELLAAEKRSVTGERKVSIIARSPASPVVRAFVARREDLKRRQVLLQAIFADIGPDDALAEFTSAVIDLHGGACARDSVRWARNACLKDAHEQLILGTHMCWSGDCMRREPGKRDSLDLFEADAADAVRLGVLAFDAIWAISETVSETRLRTGLASRPSAAYAAGHEERISALSFLRKSDRANPLAH